MPEIERKFLVEDVPPLDGWNASRLEQGYCSLCVGFSSVCVASKRLA